MDDEKIEGGFHSGLGEPAPIEPKAEGGDSPEPEGTDVNSIESTSSAATGPSFHTAPIPPPPSRAPAGYVPPSYDLPARTNPFAIVSFVLAFFFSILSIVFGHVALSQIKRTGEKGRGFALAGLWISYLSVTAVVVTVATLWLVALNAENAAKSELSSAYGGGGAAYSPPAYSYDSTPQPYATAGGDGALPAGGSSQYSYPTQPTWSASTADGPAGVPLPSTSTPQSNADRAYCQNQGVLLWLAKSTTYRGALCSMNGSLTLISMASDVGGNVTLPAEDDSSSFSATGADGAVYRYTQDSVTITTPSQTFTEPTSLWEAGTSSDLASPGDLGISTPISYPSCDGSAMIVYGTSWNDPTNADQVQQLLAAHPGSSYMRTDLSCRDFTGPSTASSGGAYVYAVYSIASGSDAACQAITGTSYYGRILSNSNDPGDNVLKCS